jgi:hypothetical protein
MTIKDRNRSEEERIKGVITTMLTAVVILAGVALMLRISKTMVSDLKDMGL